MPICYFNKSGANQSVCADFYSMKSGLRISNANTCTCDEWYSFELNVHMHMFGGYFAGGAFSGHWVHSIWCAQVLDALFNPAKRSSLVIFKCTKSSREIVLRQPIRRESIRVDRTQGLCSSLLMFAVEAKSVARREIWIARTGTEWPEHEVRSRCKAKFFECEALESKSCYVRIDIRISFIFSRSFLAKANQT